MCMVLEHEQSMNKACRGLREAHAVSIMATVAGAVRFKRIFKQGDSWILECAIA